MSELHVSELKNVLGLTKPAISSKDFIPIFSHFCFSGDKVVGYSEPLGIEVEYDSGIHGGVKADTILTWVNALPESKSVDYKVSGETIRMKCGRSSLDLSCIGEDEFLHEKPEANGLKVTITKDFIEALDACSLSVDTNSGNPSMAGITISKVNDTIFFHSTNGIAISEYMLPVDNEEKFFDGTIIVPGKFATVLKKLFDTLPSHTATAYFNSSSVLVDFEGDYKVTMWSKLLDTEQTTPLDFESEISKALEGFDLGSCFTVNEDIISVMKRLLSVYSTSTTESRMVNIESSGKTINLVVDKPNFNMNESIEIDTPQGRVSATIELEKLVNALRSGCGMAMLANLVVVTSDKLTYLQAYKHG
jgi:DNA polymerase III sliding clamp (beta) subunit (PCNA family)